MQFRRVVRTNVPAVRPWRSLGFATVGGLPLACRRPSGEYVDAPVMFRSLDA